MKKFCASIEGSNCLISIENQIQKLGFFTTRYVEATSKEEAEWQVVEQIKNDNELNNSLMNSEYDHPMILVTELVEISSFENITRSGSGYTFFPEE
jgi:hypothetical protein